MVTPSRTSLRNGLHAHPARHERPAVAATGRKGRTVSNSILTPGDLAEFNRFGITADVLHEAGIRRVTDREARDVLTTPHKGDCAGILFPYCDPLTGHTVTCRVRRDHPEVDATGKRQRKYLAAWGDAPHVYFPPSAGRVLDDVTTPLVFVEAEKSALAFTAASRRLARPLLAVGLGGCWGWRTQRAGKADDASGARVNVAGPQPDLDRIATRGRDAVILFDSNAATNPKVQHARRTFAADLMQRGARVRIGTVPSEPDVNGPDDYRAKHDDAALCALLDAAVPVQPPTVDDVLSDAGALALPDPTTPSQAEPVLLAVGDAMRGANAVRVAAVRSQLVALLKDRGITDAARCVDAALKSQTTEPDEPLPFLALPEPWPDPVNIADVLDRIVALLRQYIVLPSHAAEAIALWVSHAYLMAEWETSPLLALLSPTMRCGKSHLLELVECLTPRALMVSSLTPAVLFRAVEAWQPTLLADEADTWLSDDKSELRGVFNSGWRRATASVARCDGEDLNPRLFRTWAPKAIAAIGKLPDTVTDRSIVIQLRRKTEDERVDRFRRRRIEAQSLPIRAQLQRWAIDHAADVRGTVPDLLESLNDRANDNWEPLRTVAMLAGDEWLKRADASALGLSGVEPDVDEQPSLTALADLRTIFGERDDDDGVIPTTDLLKALADLSDRPWATWSHGQPITAHRLARLLRPFGIVSFNARTGGKPLKCYRLDACLDAFKRYLPQDPGFKALHRINANESGPNPAISESLQTVSVAVPKIEVPPMNSGLCSDVAVSIPESRPGTLFEDF